MMISNDEIRIYKDRMEIKNHSDGLIFAGKKYTDVMVFKTLVHVAVRDAIANNAKEKAGE